MVAAVEFKENRLIRALPGDDYQRWLPSLEHVELPLGQVLYESGAVLSHVYFPTTAIVSLLYVMANGASAEIAVVGNEVWWVSRCSWVASPRRVARWCKVLVGTCA
jgi:hypothetical protein